MAAPIIKLPENFNQLIKPFEGKVPKNKSYFLCFNLLVIGKAPLNEGLQRRSRVAPPAPENVATDAIKVKVQTLSDDFYHNQSDHNLPSTSAGTYKAAEDELLGAEYANLPTGSEFGRTVEKIRERLNGNRSFDVGIPDMEYFTLCFRFETGNFLPYRSAITLPDMPSPIPQVFAYFPQRCESDEEKMHYLMVRYEESKEYHRRFGHVSPKFERNKTVKAYKQGEMRKEELFSFHKLGKHIHGFFVVIEFTDDSIQRAPEEMRYLIDIFNKFKFPLFKSFDMWEYGLQSLFDRVCAWNLHFAEFLRWNAPIIDEHVGSGKCKFRRSWNSMSIYEGKVMVVSVLKEVRFNKDDGDENLDAEYDEDDEVRVKVAKKSRVDKNVKKTRKRKLSSVDTVVLNDELKDQQKEEIDKNEADIEIMVENDMEIDEAPEEDGNGADVVAENLQQPGNIIVNDSIDFGAQDEDEDMEKKLYYIRSMDDNSDAVPEQEKTAENNADETSENGVQMTDGHLESDQRENYQIRDFEEDISEQKGDTEGNNQRKNVVDDDVDEDGEIIDHTDGLDNQNQDHFGMDNVNDIEDLAEEEDEDRQDSEDDSREIYDIDGMANVGEPEGSEEAEDSEESEDDNLMHGVDLQNVPSVPTETQESDQINREPSVEFRYAYFPSMEPKCFNISSNQPSHSNFDRPQLPPTVLDTTTEENQRNAYHEAVRSVTELMRPQDPPFLTNWSNFSTVTATQSNAVYPGVAGPSSSQGFRPTVPPRQPDFDQPQLQPVFVPPTQENQVALLQQFINSVVLMTQFNPQFPLAAMNILSSFVPMTTGPNFGSYAGVANASFSQVPSVNNPFLIDPLTNDERNGAMSSNVGNVNVELGPTIQHNRQNLLETQPIFPFYQSYPGPSSSQDPTGISNDSFSMTPATEHVQANDERNEARSSNLRNVDVELDSTIQQNSLGLSDPHFSSHLFNLAAPIFTQPVFPLYQSYPGSSSSEVPTHTSNTPLPVNPPAAPEANDISDQTEPSNVENMNAELGPAIQQNSMEIFEAPLIQMNEENQLNNATLNMEVEDDMVDVDSIMEDNAGVNDGYMILIRPTSVGAECEMEIGAEMDIGAEIDVGAEMDIEEEVQEEENIEHVEHRTVEQQVPRFNGETIYLSALRWEKDWLTYPEIMELLQKVELEGINREDFMRGLENSNDKKAGNSAEIAAIFDGVTYDGYGWKYYTDFPKDTVEYGKKFLKKFPDY